MASAGTWMAWERRADTVGSLIGRYQF